MNKLILLSVIILASNAINAAPITFLSANVSEKSSEAISEGETIPEASSSLAQTEWGFFDEYVPEHAKSLKGKMIVRYLLAAAEDAYVGATQITNLQYFDRIRLLEFHEDDFSDSEYRLQFGIYEIVRGGKNHKGKKIMAIAGLNGLESGQAALDWIQSLAFGPTEEWNERVQEAVRIANEYEVDYVTGHSLGGLMAEIVTSYTGIDGASFNAPGNYYPGMDNNLVDGGRQSEARFNVHLMTDDPFSLVGAANHIAVPKMEKSSCTSNQYTAFTCHATMWLWQSIGLF